MDPADDFGWDILDCSFLLDHNHNLSGNVDIDLFGVRSFENECAIEPARPQIDTDFSSGGGTRVASTERSASTERECSRKRWRGDSCSRPGTKACREKMRREKLNEKFFDLSDVLEPGRTPKTDKPAILDDAIRVLNQLRTEGQELRKTNEKLLEEIKTLKADKNELHEEKLALKSDKEKMEQQMKSMAIPPPPASYLPTHHPVAAAYHAQANKMPVYPGYGFVPMWQYMPSSVRDTSHDHVLRPPAA